jgi:membrane associated rhomboid family serine protease
MDDETDEGKRPPVPHPPVPTSQFGNEGERRSGLLIETCYRHPDVVTGVHCTRCGRPICTDCMTPAPVGYQCPECVAQAGAGRPRVRIRLSVGAAGVGTSALIAANVVMFVIEVVTGASRSIDISGNVSKMVDLGASYPPAIAIGHQYWRLFTAMFLHFGLLHLALNMYGLYLFGTLIESALGTRRFLAIYFVSGLLASVASFALSNPFEVSAGASGAIFGILGAWVAYNYRRREMRFNRANLQWAYTLIAINLVLGFSGALPVDNFAHVGGLVAGALAAAFAEIKGSPTTRAIVRVGGFVFLIAVGIGLTAWRVAVFPGSLF